METSYQKAHPFGNRYPEWRPNNPSDNGQDSNPRTRGSQDPQSASDSTVARFLPQRISTDSVWWFIEVVNV